MGLFDTTASQSIITTLNLSQKAETIIANNLANYDTPGYKSESLSFQHELAAAIAKGPEAIAQVKGQVMVNTMSLQPDLNSVSMTQQTTDLAKTQLLYQTAVQAFNYKTTEIKIVSEGRAL
ncbi:flagellar basal body rod protein FlgB [Sulfobacillus thermosulfidooxidans]|uniref:flagellar basal body rod protein FlgB n=1 Tax=Sulfobacillus thermosulfidooxidans TaxID=28034 RepID=UPI00096BA120|nr:flagellar basal body protein [Sulfobacillus thermosulfidooxidans]OLZ11799.1 flagellar basal body rod protein [Sulfobacillus thermosulfidooxidans]OLZ17063.1 flagellar basal body rod protein [Sulfobacillus thermosulfidooxidans]OLZ20159.1 flagellar basal body rod protein [Sulfobacillus thermosulfidooxidans]